MFRAGSVVAAIALGSVVALSSPAQASVPADGSAGSCGTWTSSVVTTGAGLLENLEFDGNVVEGLSGKIKEVQERHPALKRGSLGYQSHILGFLY